MPGKVELTIMLDDSVWMSLVELSRAKKDKNPSATVECWILQHLSDFLNGKIIGTQEGAETCIEAIKNHKL